MTGTQLSHASEDKPAVFARAHPEKVSITEEYQYRAEISVNPIIALDGERTGCIEVIVPYDGYKCFTRDAIKDVANQVGESIGSGASADVEAVIGHLVLGNVRDALTTSGSPLVPLHGAIPLAVPVRSSTLRRDDDLSSDKQETLLRIDYVPPEDDDRVYPIAIDVELTDPDDLHIPMGPLWASAEKKDRKEVSSLIVRQAAFSSELRLAMRIRLVWPRRSEKEPTAKIKRISLVWPTVTSLSPSSLRFYLGDRMADIQHNPETRSLEWVDIPIEPEPDDTESAVSDPTESGAPPKTGSPVDAKSRVPGGRDTQDNKTDRPSERSEPATDRDDDKSAGRENEAGTTDDADVGHDNDDYRQDEMWQLASKPLRLFIAQPGQLRSETTLNGEVEVEVENELLSGIDARLFDAAGRRHAAGPLKISTRLTMRFQLFLEDEFNRRFMSASHTLQFDEVIPDEQRIHDILAALRDRGFDVTSRRLKSGNDSPRWFLKATRKEGPNDIELRLAVQGRRYTTRRRAETPGWHRYTSKFESGELRVFVYGWVPRNSRELTSEINELRQSLSTRFRHVQAQR